LKKEQKTSNPDGIRITALAGPNTGPNTETMYRPTNWHRPAQTTKRRTAIC